MRIQIYWKCIRRLKGKLKELNDRNPAFSRFIFLWFLKGRLIRFVFYEIVRNKISKKGGGGGGWCERKEWEYKFTENA